MLNVLGMFPTELRQLMEDWQEPPYRGDQVFGWLYREAVSDFEQMTNLPKSLRQRLGRECTIGTGRELIRQTDPEDGTVKFLFALEDGQAIETVLMYQDYGQSVCVSTQVGCQIGCRFCASTIGGLVRNVTAAEMIEQILTVQRSLLPDKRVTHVVLMGIGEPLENYEETMRFIRLLHEPDGLNIGYRHITVSTSGIIPRIKCLAEEGIPVTLAVSLHAPNQELRTRLMPINKRYPLADLLDVCAYYRRRTGRRITFEYALMDDINDAPHHARELAEIARRLGAHVNLIPLNPSGRGISGSPPEKVSRFQEVLRDEGVTVTVRKELGANIDAACGQLRRRVLQET